ncbi:lyase family protein [Brevibacterium yomogidense]|uniref:lyase family protein n=1 Tax=Brevibacterium yomogidense TaxID=946573 RepID=UPI0018DFD23A|nr:lyase family protein [Brevibacterium yomogidense]
MTGSDRPTTTPRTPAGAAGGTTAGSGTARSAGTDGQTSLLLYAPGTSGDVAAVGDDALLGALIGAEAAWVTAQADLGLVDGGTAAEAVAALGGPADHPVGDIAAEAAAGGNPVIPLLAHLRARLADVPGASGLHRGLTSQDVMDTAIVTVLARTVTALRERLDGVVDALAELAREHRDTPALAHTLTQAALPTTAGLRFAHWARSVADVRDALPAPQSLTVQLGGAAGTRAALREIVGTGAEAGSGTGASAAGNSDPSVTPGDLEEAWARRLGLAPAGYPWHVDRVRVLTWAQALAGVSLVGQRIARDVLTGARTEVGELREAGGGGSSAMPQKSNPTVSVLLSRTGQETPGLLATVAQAVGSAVDERPDGAWHAEWSALARLQLGALTSARLLGDLTERLEVDVQAMRQNLVAAGPGVVSERLVHALGPEVTKTQVSDALSGATDAWDARERLAGLLPDDTRGRLDALLDPAGYTGDAGELVDTILATIDARLGKAADDGGHAETD